MSKRVESERRRRLILSLAIALIAVMFVCVLAAIAGPLALNAYDRSHLTRVECTVVSAEAGSASSSARGAATTQEVFIKTEDCGDFSLRWGVTKGNREKIASELEPGTRVAFDLGRGSQKLSGLLRLLHLTPLVYGYHPGGASSASE